jgi:hypothetical protein
MTDSTIVSTATTQTDNVTPPVVNEEHKSDAVIDTTTPVPQSQTTDQKTNSAAVETPKTVTPTWPQDWRQQMAGEDKEYIKQLERYASPQDLVKKLKEQDRLISSGQIKQPLPKDPTPEQLAAYRKENGIPESAEKYDLTLQDGLIIGENDKPIINNMLATMHGMNLNNEQVKSILSSYYAQEKNFVIEREKQIATAKTQTEDELRKEWGGEYRGEINRIENLLNTYSRETQEALQFGVDSNGIPLLNNPHVLRDLAIQSRIINPVSTVVAGGGTNQAASIDTEIDTIEKRMSEDRNGYFKDQKMQDRYKELLTWRENQKSRR